MKYEAIRNFARKNQNRVWYTDALDASNTNVWAVHRVLKANPRLVDKLSSLSSNGGTRNFVLDREELHALLQPDLYPICKVCGGPTTFSAVTQTWTLYCSPKCVASGCVEAREATCLERYGVPNPSQVKDFQQKREDTIMDRFGVANIFELKSVQRNIKRTMKKKYGVANASQSEEVKAKKIATFVEHYGKEHWTKAESMKHKLRPFTKANLEKARKTMQDRYGVTNPFELQRVQEELWLHKTEKYEGLPESEWPTYIHKVVVDKRGTRHCVQGYEDRAIEYIDNASWVVRICSKWSEIPRYRYKFGGTQHNYYPDLVVFSESNEHVVEVKSEFTLNINLDRNIAKFKVATRSCLRKGNTFWVFCYCKDGKLRKAKNPASIRDLEKAGFPVSHHPV